MEKDIVAQMDFKDIVGPIDQQPAPDHDENDRKIDPVHPADGEWMFGDDFFHGLKLATICGSCAGWVEPVSFIG